MGKLEAEEQRHIKMRAERSGVSSKVRRVPSTNRQTSTRGFRKSSSATTERTPARRRTTGPARRHKGIRTRSRGVGGLCADELDQAFVLLATRRAAAQMGAHARHGGIGIDAGQLQLDVAVELGEAGVAADLGLGRPKEAAERLLQLWRFSHRASSVRDSGGCP